MAGASSQAPLPLLFSISLIICLSGVVKAQDMKRQQGKCEVAKVVSADKCDLIGDSVVLIAIHNGAVYVALKLDRHGKRMMNGMDQLMAVSEEAEGKRRKKRQEPATPTRSPGNRRRGGDTRMERFDGRMRGRKQVPTCIKVPKRIIDVCKKRMNNGSKCGRPMTFKPLLVQLLNGDSEDLDVDMTPLMAKRKVRAGVVDCTEQVMVTDDDGETFLVDQVTLEYNTRVGGVNVTMEVQLYFFKNNVTFNGVDIPAGSLKTKIEMSIQCDEDDSSKCDQIKVAKLSFLINLGATRLGKYKCDKEKPKCNIGYRNGGRVEFNTKYMLDDEENELDSDALTNDGKNIFTISFPTPMNGKKHRKIIYDPLVSGTAEEYTGSEEQENIRIGVYSTAATRSFYYPMFILTLLVNLFARFP